MEEVEGRSGVGGRGVEAVRRSLKLKKKPVPDPMWSMRRLVQEQGACNGLLLAASRGLCCCCSSGAGVVVLHDGLEQRACCLHDPP